MEDDFKLEVQHQRRVNPKIHEVIKNEVIKLLDAGLIYPISDSPWVSPVHCVPKKGGMTVIENDNNELIPTRLVMGWRICIDYRKLNDATRKDHFPLPFIDQMLERLVGNEYYCFLDSFSGYFQIPIDPCMMAIFHDMIEETMEVFMDDFLVFGDYFSSCLSYLDKMLKQCEDTNLVLNWEKCHFMRKHSKSYRQTLDTDDEETLESICKVAELVGRCTAWEPYQRPDMGHAVNEGDEWTSTMYDYSFGQTQSGIADTFQSKDDWKLLLRDVAASFDSAVHRVHAVSFDAAVASIVSAACCAAAGYFVYCCCLLCSCCSSILLPQEDLSRNLELTESTPIVPADSLNSIPADNVPAGRSSSIPADYVSAGHVLVPADIGFKWLFKKKIDMDGNVHNFKARLVVKGFTQTYRVDYVETFSPIAYIRAIRILLAIAAYYDYQIWQIDVKTAFLNGHLSEDIYMVQPQGFLDPKHPNKVCKLQHSICGLNQASRIWIKRFDEEIKKISFTQNPDEPCVYLKASGSNVVFLVLYFNDILLMGNSVTMPHEVKSWLCKCFPMKDLGEASYILGIKIIRDRSKRLIALSQSSYIEKILKKFRMENSKKGYTPMMEKPDYRKSRFQQNPGEIYWIVVKTILKYLRNTKDMVLVYGVKPKDELIAKQSTTAMSSTEAEYIVAAKASMEALCAVLYREKRGEIYGSHKSPTAELV
ncbi:retrotransposon protein, putative, ty1-copia subclass [Tanacetum coccineum]